MLWRESSGGDKCTAEFEKNNHFLLINATICCIAVLTASENMCEHAEAAVRRVYSQRGDNQKSNLRLKRMYILPSDTEYNGMIKYCWNKIYSTLIQTKFILGFNLPACHCREPQGVCCFHCTTVRSCWIWFLLRYLNSESTADLRCKLS